ncbi:MAG: DNA-entry nuclease [Actinobacteria bacterium]|nr:DNA-entry nuclease [Actinomycetota bacterium]
MGLSKTRYPAVRRHWEAAIANGWPRVLTVHRAGAERRRSMLLAGMPTRPGMDRDEYPMAMARTSVKADVAYVDSGQNRGAGSVQGIKLRRYCSGQRFKIVWY